MKYGRIAVAAVAMAALLSSGSVANAQADPNWLGTTSSGLTAGLAEPQQLEIPLTYQYSNASYGTGGVALRNRSEGYIQISGVTGPTQAAYLYWAVLLSNPTQAQVNSVASVQLQREYPMGVVGPTGSPIVPTEFLVGTLLNVGGDPCWGSTGTWVYRAVVSTSLATGNGTYKVVIPPAAAGLTDGENPWGEKPVFPLWEGASLVIVGQGSANVGLLDGQAGTTFAYTYSNYYQLPATVATGSQVLFDNFGYDGQISYGRIPTDTWETTIVTGIPSAITVVVAGPGGETGDSDWDGSAGWPLPQLWDDTRHFISNAFAPGDSSVFVQYYASGDCVGTVGAVISVK